MDNTSIISGIRARGFKEADISDASIEAIIAECLHEFSRYRSVIADTTFETVAGKQRYTWTEIGDEDGQRALLVVWNSVLSVSNWALLDVMTGLQVPRDDAYWHLPSQAIIEQIKASAYSANCSGSGYQNDSAGGSVYLDPVPSQSGAKVHILYTKAVGSVNDIRDADRDIFLDLLDSACSDRMVVEICDKSSAVRVKTPEYEREIGAKIGVWRSRTKEMRERFTSKCQAGYAAGSRS